jgi:hypothetical protein
VPPAHPVAAVDGYLSRLSAAHSDRPPAALAGVTPDAPLDLARVAERTLD